MPAAYSVISEIIDNELEEHKKSAACEDEDSAGLRSVFLNILELKELDIRDKKSAIIDFIAAGIETVSSTSDFFSYLSILLSLELYGFLLLLLVPLALPVPPDLSLFLACVYLSVSFIYYIPPQSLLDTFFDLILEGRTLSLSLSLSLTFSTSIFTLI